MFKFVVLCALLAAAAAEPGLISPIAYSGGYVAPAAYPYYNGLSNLVYPSSYVPSTAVTYNAPLAHLIKKRSVPLVGSYLAPTPLATSYASTYSAAIPAYSPIATTYGAAFPSLYSSPLYTTGHLIKKRAALLPVASSYIAPTTLTSTYTAASPLIPSAFPYSSYISPAYPGAYTWPAQFIKK